MPVSSTHFRGAQAFNPSRLPASKENNLLQHPERATNPQNGVNLRTDCLEVVNTIGQLNFQPPPLAVPQNAMSFSLQLLLLLSQIQPTETYFPSAVANPLSTGLALPDNQLTVSPTQLIHLNNHALATQISNENVAFTDWLNFLPGAAAAPVTTTDEGLILDADNTTFILTNEQKITDLITAIKNFFIDSGQLDEEQGDALELELRTQAAGYPVLITEFDIPDANTTRHRRILADQFRPRETAEHIRKNCVVEEEVLDTEGENSGKLLIFQAQRAEQPFRVIYDNNPNGRPTPEERGIADGLDTSVDIISLGLKSYIGGLVASAKRYSYYHRKGDFICAQRNRRLFIAELSTGLAADNLEYPLKGKSGLIKPGELKDALAVEERAAYFTRSRQTNIRKEVLFGLKEGDKLVSDNGRQVYLKPTKNEGEFVTWHPHAANPKALERRVIVDGQKKTWRYADRFDSSQLEVEVMEGKSHIKLYGDYYELQMNHKQQYEIVVHQKSGITKYLPVYMEPLSRTWHLTTNNNIPVFTRKQEGLIAKLKTKTNTKFTYFPTLANNKKRYGSATVYRAEMTGDTSHYSQGDFIEMRGEILPVRQKVTRAHGVRYEVFDEKKSYAIEWDGQRWIFEQPTSPHVSKEVKALVTKSMYEESIDASKVSASDSYGLKWDDAGNTYLKINDNYVKVNKLNGNRYALPTPKSKTILRFQKNKFFIETPRERLENIMTVGLNGGKRKRPLDILKDIDGYTEESASQLLSGYDFPEHGFYSAQAFALHIEQNLVIPPWAKRFKKAPSEIIKSTATAGSVPVRSWRYPELEFEFRLGNQHADGSLRHIFTDADNDDFIIKRFSTQTSTTPLHDALTEANSFDSYYGHGAAELFYDKDGNYYVRMYKTPGMTLDEIPPLSLPADVEEKFVDMLEIINESDISYDDLQAADIFWDDTAQIFYPVGPAKGHFDAGNTPLVSKDKKGYWGNVLNELSKKKSSQKTKAAVEQPNINNAQGIADGSVAKPGGKGSASGSVAKPGGEGSVSGSVAKPGGEGSASGSVAKPGGQDSASSNVAKPGGQSGASGSVAKPGGQGSASSSVAKPGGQGSTSGSMAKPGGQGSASGSVAKPGGQGSASGSVAKPGGEGSASGSVAKPSGQDLAVAAPGRPAAPARPQPPLVAMLTKAEEVNTLLRTRTLSSDVITQKLEEVCAFIFANKERLIQETQVQRMVEMLSEIEKAINNSENLAEVAAFINNSIPEVITPGYLLRQQWGEAYEFTTFKWNNALYSTRTAGPGRESSNLLFPEFGEVELKQHELDATEYERAVARLSPEQREALRTWTALPVTGDDSYSDGSRPSGRNINYEMNRNLRNGIPLPAEQQEVYNDMMSALNSNILPRQHGEYIRTAAYAVDDHNPWLAGDIKPGDLVSNLRQFMSVSSDTSFAKTYSMGLGVGSKAIVHYKIKSATGPTPLLPFALTVVANELEYLYKPESLFKVAEYSVTEKLPPLRFRPQAAENTGHNRIGVLLEEVDTSQLKEPVKAFDIFSGKQDEIRLPVEQS